VLFKKIKTIREGGRREERERRERGGREEGERRERGGREVGEREDLSSVQINQRVRSMAFFVLAEYVSLWGFHSLGFGHAVHLTICALICKFCCLGWEANQGSFSLFYLA